MPAGAVTVDHGLQAGSAERAEATATLLRGLGLAPVLVRRVEVGTAGGPEAAARAARTAWLDAVATEHGARIALGHTRDDQAETVLLGLGRGSGPALAGRHGRGARAPVAAPAEPAAVEPPPGRLRRAGPAGLGATRTTSTPPTPRVRVRAEVLPLLEQVLAAGSPRRWPAPPRCWREDVEALDALVAAVPDPTDCGALAALPAAVRRRVLRRWLLDHGVGDLAAVHLQAVDALVVAWRGQGRVDLPGGAGVVRASGRLALQGPPVRSTTIPSEEPHP